MLWLPLDSAGVANVAAPLLRAAMPRLAFRSKNCTVPVAPAEGTVAVNVTLWPPADGFALEVRVVDVLATGQTRLTKSK